jgi:hypothetical protein
VITQKGNYEIGGFHSSLLKIQAFKDFILCHWVPPSSGTSKKLLQSFEMLMSTHPASHCQSLEDLNLQKAMCLASNEKYLVANDCKGRRMDINCDSDS